MLSLDDSSLDGLPRDGIREEALPSGPSDFFPGDLVADRYRLEVLLGEGAMGMVWRAHDQDLDREVAIKTVHPQLYEQAGEPLARRIQNEARITASLDDPGIVRVLDVGRTDKSVYVVMECLEGPTLETWMLERNLIDPIETIRIILPLLRSLEVAHRNGVIHRDVKPGNVMMVPRPDGTIQPKLLDFGIARRIDDDTRLTATGQLVGTPLYMSYEQAAGREADHRSDLWAVASIAYEMIVGVAPFEADNYHAVLRRILMTDREPMHLQPRIDRELAGLLERGLEADPRDRWQSATEFAAGLADWFRHRNGVMAIDGTRVDDVSISAHGFAAPVSSAPPIGIARHELETSNTILGVGPSLAPSEPAPTPPNRPIPPLPMKGGHRGWQALAVAVVGGACLLFTTAWPTNGSSASEPAEATVAASPPPPRQVAPPSAPPAWEHTAVAAKSVAGGPSRSAPAAPSAGPRPSSPTPSSAHPSPPAGHAEATPSAASRSRPGEGSMPLPSRIHF